MSKNGLVPRCVESLLLESSFQISDGNRFRTDLVHVSDVSSAILSILEKEAVGTFNIASGRILSPLDIANTAAEIIGRSKECIKVNPSSGPPPLEFSGINIENARYKLDYYPISLSDGLADYINSIL
jgi:nucleoside-diphosphate-sugar epimerase